MLIMVIFREKNIPFVYICIRDRPLDLIIPIGKSLFFPNSPREYSASLVSYISVGIGNESEHPTQAFKMSLHNVITKQNGNS